MGLFTLLVIGWNFASLNIMDKGYHIVVDSLVRPISFFALFQQNLLIGLAIGAASIIFKNKFEKEIGTFIEDSHELED